MTWSFQGKGAEKCRRKRCLWKMASICSAHHYSAEQSQLLRWIQGRTARWSWQSRYLCWGRIWEDLQEKRTRMRKRFLTLRGCLHSWLGWKGKRGSEVLWQGGATWFLHSQMLDSVPLSLKMGDNVRMARPPQRLQNDYNKKKYSAHNFPVRKFCFLHAAVSLSIEVKWKRFVWRKWLHEGICFCTLSTNLQRGPGKLSAYCPEGPADRQECDCDVLVSDNRAKAPSKLCDKDHTWVTSCLTLHWSSGAFDVMQFYVIQMWVKGVFGFSPQDWMRIIFT